MAYALLNNHQMAGADPVGACKSHCDQMTKTESPARAAFHLAIVGTNAPAANNLKWVEDIADAVAVCESDADPDHDPLQRDH